MTLLVASVLALASPATPDTHRMCQRTYTRPMITRAIDAAYHGTRDITSRDRHHLRRFIRCARPGVDRHAMRRYQDRAQRAWQARRNPPYNTAIASWYALSGGGACGLGDVQSGYRVADKWMACGTRLEICRAGCVSVIVSDRGPYVAGREFDLNVNTRNAVGCAGVCVVRWRYA